MQTFLFSNNIVVTCTSMIYESRDSDKADCFVCVFMALDTLGHWFTLMLDDSIKVCGDSNIHHASEYKPWVNHPFYSIQDPTIARSHVVLVGTLVEVR
ncbi:hypothetical protein BD769DRAFT_1777133 [Suillus cothurnatus]|nr:hypothetical protein BD769DRAFT_1777133 [Suillus cothurnatus]